MLDIGVVLVQKYAQYLLQTLPNWLPESNILGLWIEWLVTNLHAS